MPNTITTQVLVDGDRVTRIKYFITGDGSGEETNTVLYDASTSANQSTNNALRGITYQLNGFSARLDWDATANVKLITLDSDLQEVVDYSEFGGIINNATTGRTGDILITTTGLGAADEGYIVLSLNQRGK